MSLSPQAVEADLVTRFADLVPTPYYGETALFYNPGHQLKLGSHFATLKEKDGENDRASGLTRSGVWRFNFGLPKAVFEREFGPQPPRPGKGQTIEGPYDFTELNLLMPHPVYGWGGWVAILNPSAETYETLLPLIEAGYKKSKANADSRLKKAKS